MIVNPMQEARTAAHTAFLSATLDAEDLDTRLDKALDTFAAVLTRAGRLADDDAELPDSDELDHWARQLAYESGFARYVDGEGWRMLRTSRVDIETAYLKAKDRPGCDPQWLNIVRRMLLTHAAQRGGEQS
ncbi:hypothetical protein AB0B89_36210 [Sphaerisporangium sp. NPDC049002]|uniref:hypothetical protein n=1 Tax=Sphaerisporangium sp. NPDC049002 TaxID=3155392 RepID=UPI0033E63D9B